MTTAIEPLYLPGFDDAVEAAGSLPPRAADDVVRPPPTTGRTFAGLPIPTLVLAALVVILALLSAWQTQQILALRSHRIVSVSLATIVRDFIAAESRNGGSPGTAAARTKLYLAATQSAIRGLTDHGATVVVSEAVVGNSVPDVTTAVKADVEAKLKGAQVSAAMGGK